MTAPPPDGPTSTSDPRSSEFDAYATGYDAGMGNPLKRLLGDNAEQYIAVKTRWLNNDLRSFGQDPAILDFGCGEGALLRQLAETRKSASLHGCDVSEAMIREARKRWPPTQVPPDLRPFAGSRAPFPDQCMDVVVACAVFHHISVSDRPAAFREMMRVLRPGGRAYVFEHNPLNPLTVRVVRSTPIDRNAVLLRVEESLAGLRGAGAVHTRARYMHFTPPRFGFLSWIDPLLSRVALGAGYVVCGERAPELARGPDRDEGATMDPRSAARPPR